MLAQSITEFSNQALICLTFPTHVERRLLVCRHFTSFLKLRYIGLFFHLLINF